MILCKIIFYCLFFLSFRVSSALVSDHISFFLKKEYPLNRNHTNTIVPSELKGNPPHYSSIFLLLNNIDNLKKICLETSNQVHYQPLQKKMQIKVKYITVNRIIPRGTKIQESDLQVLFEFSNKLPYNTYFNKKDIINRISLRDIYPSQPITSLMIRPFWLVKINQNVILIIKAINFDIISKGKSLTNAAINDLISVRSDSGKILTGVVNERGEVIINI